MAWVGKNREYGVSEVYLEKAKGGKGWVTMREGDIVI